MTATSRSAAATFRSGSLQASRDYEIAAAIRDAINSPAVQAMLRLQATLSDGTSSGTAGRTNKIVLFGNASGDILVRGSERPALDETIEYLGVPGEGDPLREAILGTGIAAVGTTVYLSAALPRRASSAGAARCWDWIPASC
jgi:hypothetical protein